MARTGGWSRILVQSVFYEPKLGFLQFPTFHTPGTVSDIGLGFVWTIRVYIQLWRLDSSDCIGNLHNWLSLLLSVVMMMLFRLGASRPTAVFVVCILTFRWTHCCYTLHYCHGKTFYPRCPQCLTGQYARTLKIQLQYKGLACCCWSSLQLDTCRGKYQKKTAWIR